MGITGFFKDLWAGGNWLQRATYVVGFPLLAFTVVAVIYTLVFADTSSGRVEREQSAPEDYYLAERACKRAVESHLKAPATADFTVVSATKESSREWTVTGTVDAENSFGAKIRNNWICTATKSGESWTGDALVY